MVQRGIITIGEIRVRFAVRWLTAAAIASCLGAERRADAQVPTLAEPALARQLQRRVTLTWRDQSIGQALANLGSSQGLPIWIDRRLDPSGKVNLAASDQLLSDVLTRLVTEHGGQAWGWTPWRSIVYFGPRQTADELATLSAIARDRLAKAPAEMRRRWLAPAAFSYPRLSQPRELLDELAASIGASLQHASAVPHDLWPAQSTPPLAAIDRVVLLLAGFELQGEISADGRQLRVAPIKRPLQMSREYALTARSEPAIMALEASDPRVDVRRRGRRALVAAPWEHHEQIRAAMRGQTLDDEPPSARPRSNNAGEQRFTLTLENQPLKRVLEHLALQLQLTFLWDQRLRGGAEEYGEKLVSCDVAQADLDEVLRAILAPAELSFVRDGRTITICSAE
jgi:hypothetical protein